MSDKQLTKDQLVMIAKSFNETLGLDPPIKVTTKTKVSALLKDVEEVISELEDGDTIDADVSEILFDHEYDLPGKIKLTGGKTKGKAKSSVKASVGKKKTSKKGKEQKAESSNAGKKNKDKLSNKAICYLEWKKNKKVTADFLYKKVDQRVQHVTITIWIKQWEKGKNLPAIAGK